MNDIASSIRQLALRGAEIYLTICTVDAVDEKARTIDCTPINEGAPLLGVNLQADQTQNIGLVNFPAVGSDVVVGFLSPAVAVVLLTTQLDKAIITIGSTELTLQDGKFLLDVNGTTLEIDGDKTVWNGGSETTANASNLKEELQKMSGRIDAIVNAISSSPVSPMDGGAAYKAAMTTIVKAPPKEDFSNIIDDKIKH